MARIIPHFEVEEKHNKREGWKNNSCCLYCASFTKSFQNQKYFRAFIDFLELVPLTYCFKKALKSFQISGEKNL